MKTLVIHQTQYLPYIGLFSKLVDADAFMFLDTVYYSSTAFINRNRVLTHDGVRWITIPVTLEDSLHTEIHRVQIASNGVWKRKHLSMLQNAYSRHPYFSAIYPIYKEALTQNETFQDICISIVKSFCDYLGLNIDFTLASQFSSEHYADEEKIARLIRLTAAVDCNVYVGGVGSLSYTSEEDFAKFQKARIQFAIRDYTPEPYTQNGWKEDFVPNLSIFDLLANMSPCACVAYLKRTNNVIR